MSYKIQQLKPFYSLCKHVFNLHSPGIKNVLPTFCLFLQRVAWLNCGNIPVFLKILSLIIILLQLFLRYSSFVCGLFKKYIKSQFLELPALNLSENIKGGNVLLQPISRSKCCHTLQFVAS